MSSDAEYLNSLRQGWTARSMERCPTCHRAVVVNANGTLSDHYRYADDTDPNQPHARIRCEGGWTP